jgi:hypothetical protein
MKLDDRYLLQQLFQQVVEQTETLCALLQEDQDTFIWLDPNAEQRISIEDPVERLCFILRLYTLHPSQKPKTVLVCPGFVAASPSVFSQFEKMNHARQAFKDKMVQVRKELLGITDPTIDNQFGNPSHERPQLIDVFLQEIKLDHLHFKHVYRCPPILKDAPAQLSWTWALTQSIKKITSKQAIELVSRRNTKGQMDQELQKLHALPPSTTLSLRQDLAPHLRINWTDFEGKRKMLKGTLPVIFPKGSQLPITRPARPLEDRLAQAEEKRESDLLNSDNPSIETKKTFRKDRTIGQEPFVACIRAFLDKDIQAQFYKNNPQWLPRED